MMNKRLGVQIGASGLAVLLASLGIAQTRKDSHTPDEPQWEVESPPAAMPAPIAAVPTPFSPNGDDGDPAWNSSAPNAAIGMPNYGGAGGGLSGQEHGFPGESDPSMVRQVVYEDSFALPPPQSFPDDPDPAAAQAPQGYESYGAPAAYEAAPADEETAGPIGPADPAAGPAGFALPGWSDQPATEPPTATSNAALAAPSPILGGPSAVQEASDEPNAYADSFASPPTNQLRDGPFPETSDDAPEQAPAFAGAPLAVQPMADDFAYEDEDENTETEDSQPAAMLAFGVPSDSEPAGDFQAAAADDFVDAPGAGNFAAVPPMEVMPPMSGAATDDPPASEALAEIPPMGMNSPRLASLPEAAGGMAQVPGVMSEPPSLMDVADNDQDFAAAPAAPFAAASLAGPSPATPSLTVMGNPAMGMAAAPADDQLLNEPGDRRLEGVQAPSIVVQKRAPDQVKVGRPANFVIQIQNVGVVEAAAVQIHDRIPAGMRLVETTPQAQIEGDRLSWNLGTLEPGGERTVSIQLIPETEGELGSVARVTFEAAAAVRTMSTRPALQVVQRAPAQVLIGQQIEIELEVSNPGTGAADSVILQTDVPDGLEHPKGRQLDNLIGTLGPGEVRRQVLRLRAVAPGTIENEIRVSGEDGLVAVDRAVIEVIAPELAIDLQGPSRRFLERQATYQIQLANVGSAEATNVEIVAYLDRGFSFVGTEYQGQYDPNRHAVYWSLAELPADARGAVPLTLLPIEQGERAIRLEASGDLNLVSRHEKKVQVDAPAELTFSITDDADPVEVGSMATYEIRILNRGALEDGEVSLQLQLPEGLELVSSEGDASTDGRGLVVFAPQPSLPARGEIIHRVRVKGVKPGTHIARATVTSRQAPIAVTKEESTTVYADE